MWAKIVAGVAAAVALLFVGWLLGRHGALPPPPAPTREGVAVVAARSADAPAPRAAATRAALPLPPAVPTPAAADRHVPDDGDVRGTMLDPAMQPDALYRRLRAEPIDAAGAARMQRAVGEGLVKVPYLDRDQLRTRCATTLCEVHGRFTSGASTDNLNVAMQGLQGDPLRSRLDAAGLEVATAVFGPDGFTLYTIRR